MLEPAAVQFRIQARKDTPMTDTIPGSVAATRVHSIARDIAETLLQLDCDLMGCFIRIEASCYTDKATSPYIWVVTE